MIECNSLSPRSFQKLERRSTVWAMGVVDWPERA
jgi:hypothetical protein